MKDKRNISFFILFLLYIVVFFAGFRYVGTDIFYASLPMIFGASVLYGYTAGFAAVVLNIPAMVVLMYMEGLPFADAIRQIKPFMILLQCVCVIIPGITKAYNEKKENIKAKEMQRKLDDLEYRIEKEKKETEKCMRENNELKLVVQRYKDIVEENRDRDPLTGMLTREAMIRKAQRYIALEEKKAYIFLKTRDLKDINADKGIFAGDVYIREKAEHIKKLPGEKGRLSGGSFLIIQEPDTYDADKMIFDRDLEIKVIIPKDKDRIEEIFRRWEKDD
jgi:GGDEF domain-containing protein